MNYKIALTLSFLCATNFLSYAMEISHTMEMVPTRQTIGQTDLIHAIKSKDYCKAHALIEAGVNIHETNKLGDTALMWAAMNNSVDVVDALIKAGADVDKEDKDGDTALMWAAMNNSVDVVDVLIKVGADVHKADKNSRTVLMRAAKKSSADVVDTLIKAGADVNKADENGLTALMHAPRKNSNATVVDVLIKAGADVHKVDNRGQTALVWAAMMDSVDVVDALIKAGADICNTALSFAVICNNADIVMHIMNPTVKLLGRKKIETLLMIYNEESCLSELPKELLKAVITFAYPAYAMDFGILHSLPSRVLVDTVPLETLSLLIKDGILDQKSILAAWQQKITAMFIASKINRTSTVLQFETDVLKKIETLLAGLPRFARNDDRGYCTYLAS